MHLCKSTKIIIVMHKFIRVYKQNTFEDKTIRVSYTIPVPPRFAMYLIKKNSFVSLPMSRLQIRGIFLHPLFFV